MNIRNYKNNVLKYFLMFCKPFFSFIFVALIDLAIIIRDIQFWKIKDFAITFTKDLCRGLVSVVQLLGLFFIAILLVVSMIVLIYVILKEFYCEYICEYIWLSEYYNHVVNIAKDDVSKAALTTIIASVVAISHLHNLEINRKRFRKEMEDRWRKEYEMRCTRERENQEFIKKK